MAKMEFKTDAYKAYRSTYKTYQKEYNKIKEKQKQGRTRKRNINKMLDIADYSYKYSSMREKFKGQKVNINQKIIQEQRSFNSGAEENFYRSILTKVLRENAAAIMSGDVSMLKAISTELKAVRATSRKSAKNRQRLHKEVEEFFKQNQFSEKDWEAVKRGLNRTYEATQKMYGTWEAELIEDFNTLVINLNKLSQQEVYDLVDKLYRAGYITDDDFLYLSEHSDELGNSTIIVPNFIGKESSELS